METVRLPMYDRYGIELREYLEVDTQYFLSSTAGLRSNQARVVRPAPSGFELLEEVEETPIEEPLASWEIEIRDAIEKEANEWRCLGDKEAVLSSFEINRAGVIRYKATGRVIKPTFNIDFNKERVLLIINGKTYTLDGLQVAELLWGIPYARS